MQNPHLMAKPIFLCAFFLTNPIKINITNIFSILKNWHEHAYFTNTGIYRTIHPSSKTIFVTNFIRKRNKDILNFTNYLPSNTSKVIYFVKSTFSYLFIVRLGFRIWKYPSNYLIFYNIMNIYKLYNICLAILRGHLIILRLNHNSRF
jgi:hypothetical protein